MKQAAAQKISFECIKKISTYPFLSFSIIWLKWGKGSHGERVAKIRKQHNNLYWFKMDVIWFLDILFYWQKKKNLRLIKVPCCYFFHSVINYNHMSCNYHFFVSFFYLKWIKYCTVKWSDCRTEATYTTLFKVKKINKLFFFKKYFKIKQARKYANITCSILHRIFWFYILLIWEYHIFCHTDVYNSHMVKITKVNENFRNIKESGCVTLFEILFHAHRYSDMITLALIIVKTVTGKYSIK